MDSKEIKALRKALVLTQADFASIVGVRTVTISNWERGVTMPSRLALRELIKLKKEITDYGNMDGKAILGG